MGVHLGEAARDGAKLTECQHQRNTGSRRIVPGTIFGSPNWPWHLFAWHLFYLIPFPSEDLAPRHATSMR